MQDHEALLLCTDHYLSQYRADLLFLLFMKIKVIDFLFMLE